MSEKKSIPDLVLATVRMHAARVEMDLVRVKDELDRTAVATARSRVLRGLRDQLTAQVEAWSYLAAVAGSGQALVHLPRHELYGCNGAWEIGPEDANWSGADETVNTTIVGEWE